MADDKFPVIPCWILIIFSIGIFQNSLHFAFFALFSTGIFSKSEPNIFSDFLYFTLVLWKYPLTLASGCHHLIEGKSTQTLARKLCCLKGPPVWPRLFCWYSGFETHREQPVPASEKTSKYCRILSSFFLLHYFVQRWSRFSFGLAMNYLVWFFRY